MNAALPVAVSVNQAADMLGIGRSTLYKLLKSKRLPLVKIGRRTVVPSKAIVDFMAVQSEVRA